MLQTDTGSRLATHFCGESVQDNNNNNNDDDDDNKNNNNDDDNDDHGDNNNSNDDDNNNNNNNSLRTEMGSVSCNGHQVTTAITSACPSAVTRVFSVLSVQKVFSFTYLLKRGTYVSLSWSPSPIR